MSLLSFQGRSRFLLAFLAGVIAAASMAPVHAWPALLIAVPVLIRLLDQATPRAAALIGWCFGFGYFLVSLYWIGIAFLVDAGTYGWLMPLAVTGLPAFLAVYWALACFLAQRWWTKGSLRLLVLAASFTLFEFLRGFLFTGFPWNAPGYAALASDGFAQAASVLGLWGLTFLVLAFAGVPMLLLERNFRMAGLFAAVFAAVWAAGLLRLATPLPADTGVELRIVQPAIPQSDKWRFENAGEIFRKLLDLSASAREGKPALIIWPESALPFLLDEDEAARGAIARMLPEGAWLVTGGLRREIVGAAGGPDDLVFNSVLSIAHDGALGERADKFHLVPWGEYLPLEGLLAPLGLRRLVTLPGSFMAGPGPATLHLAGLPAFSPLICYEVIFPGQVTGAERPAFLLNVTNDGWFGRSTGPYQHLDQARLRAIEEGLPLVRAANTGISAIIDAHGRLRASAALETQAVIDSRLPEALPPTIYVKLGNMTVFAMIGLVFAAAMFRRGNTYRSNRYN